MAAQPDGNGNSLTEIVRHFPKCVEVARQLQAGSSLLLYGPRFFGKRWILDVLARELRLLERAIVLELSPLPLTADGLIAYDAIGRRAAQAGLFRSQAKWSSKTAFRSAWEQSYADSDREVFVLVHGPGSQGVRRYWEFIGMMNGLLANSSRRKVRILATDDTSLLDFDVGTTVVPSVWTYFENSHYLPLNANQLSGCIERCIANLSAAQGASVVEQMMRRSGGHPGLVAEAIRSINAALDTSQEILDRPADWLRDSHILQRLAHALSQDSGALTELALRFEDWGLPGFNDPKVSLLKQLGILESRTSLDVRLFPGEIAALVKRVRGAQSRSALRGGTVATANDLVRVIEDEPEIGDDDFVVVHISDLHASEEFGFQLPSSIPARRRDLLLLDDVLLADLERMGLQQRVDALVVSGDVVTDGQQMAEFKQAELIIKRLLERLGIGPERLAIVAGNHDVGWEPTKLQSAGRFSAATRDNFNIFLQLLGKPSETLVSLNTIQSRSKRAALRILGLDSNSVESKSGAGIGLIAPEDLSAAAQHLRSATAAEYFANWAVFHHHVFAATATPLAEAGERKVSVMANASDIQQFALTHRIEMLLHGHEHQPCVTLARRWPVDSGEDFAPLISIGAGSVSVSRSRLGPFGRNQYYVLIRRKNDLVIRSRQFGSNGQSFVAHRDILVTLPMIKGCALSQKPESVAGTSGAAPRFSAGELSAETPRAYARTPGETQR